jgi:hypothetical protein
MTMKTLATLSLAGLLLSGCTSMNVFKDDASTAPPVVDLPPEEPAMKMTAPQPGGMSAKQISQKISGKSWKWTATNYSGVTLYANDGSSLIELKNAASLKPVTTTGRWRAESGMLCETVNAAPPVLKTKVEEACKPFSDRGNNSFQVGSATFVLDN